MAWTAPATWTVGQILTAALMNQQVRDNAAALAPVGESSGMVDIVSTAALTSILSQSIPANTLGTKGNLRVILIGDYLNNTGVNRGLQIKISLGGTTMYDGTNASISVNSASRFPWRLEFVVGNIGATNANYLGGMFDFPSTAPAAPTTGVGGLADSGMSVVIGSNGTTAVATTSAQTLDVSIAHSASSASLSLRRYYWVVRAEPSV